MYRTQIFVLSSSSQAAARDSTRLLLPGPIISKWRRLLETSSSSSSREVQAAGREAKWKSLISEMSAPGLGGAAGKGPDLSAGVLWRAGDGTFNGVWHRVVVELPSGVISVPASLHCGAISVPTSLHCGAPAAAAAARIRSTLSVNLSATQRQHFVGPTPRGSLTLASCGLPFSSESFPSRMIGGAALGLGGWAGEARQELLQMIHLSASSHLEGTLLLVVKLPALLKLKTGRPGVEGVASSTLDLAVELSLPLSLSFSLLRRAETEAAGNALTKSEVSRRLSLQSGSSRKGFPQANRGVSASAARKTGKLCKYFGGFT